MNASPKLVAPVVLSVGAHLSRQEGACLMEVVSQIAGERWSDVPTCTHPLLGHLARLVNDTLSDPGRQQLFAYVPALAVATSSDPATYPRVALACTVRAMRTKPSLLLRHLHHVAAAQLRRESRTTTGRASSVGRVLYQHGPAVRAIEMSVSALDVLPEPDRDAELLEFLAAAVRAVEHEFSSSALRSANAHLAVGSAEASACRTQ